MLVNFGKSIFTAAFPEFWLFALGALFIATTLFLPKGIVGTIQQGFATRRAYREAAAAEKGRVEAARSPRRPACRSHPPSPRRRVSPMDQKITNTILYLDNVSVSFDGSRR